MPRNAAIWALAAALLAAAPPGEAAPRDSAVTAGLHASTLGLGVSAGYDFSPSLAARALLNRYDYDYDDEQDGDTYRGELAFRSHALLLDWHPFGGAFRLTGGAFLNANELSVSAVGADLTIGDTPGYSGRVRAELDFEDVAPYLGLGWTTGRSSSGLSFVLEIGALFQDDPKLSAEAVLSRGSATECRVAVGEDGRASFSGTTICQTLFDNELRRDIEEEHRELADDLKNFDVYPVLLLGLSYRF